MDNQAVYITTNQFQLTPAGRREVPVFEASHHPQVAALRVRLRHLLRLLGPDGPGEHDRAGLHSEAGPHLRHSGSRVPRQQQPLRNEHLFHALVPHQPLERVADAHGPERSGHRLDGAAQRGSAGRNRRRLGMPRALPDRHRRREAARPRVPQRVALDLARRRGRHGRRLFESSLRPPRRRRRSADGHGGCLLRRRRLLVLLPGGRHRPEQQPRDGLHEELHERIRRRPLHRPRDDGHDPAREHSS